MRRAAHSRTRRIAGALALVLGLGVAAPLGADEARPATPNAGLSAAAGRAVAGATRASLALAQAQAPAVDASAPDGHGFFQSTKGKVALVLFAAGMGWTIYSTKKDRDPVKSPIR